jgi:hypothetical protein
VLIDISRGSEPKYSLKVSDLACSLSLIASSSAFLLIFRDDQVRWETREDFMTIRFIRLAAYLVLLLALGAGISFASSGLATAADGIHPASNFCVADSGFSHRGTIRASSLIRVAQQHYTCCGRDENGHCDHQCCN